MNVITFRKPVVVVPVIDKDLEQAKKIARMARTTAIMSLNRVLEIVGTGTMLEKCAIISNLSDKTKLAVVAMNKVVNG